MVKKHRVITSDKANAGAKRSLDFWSTIDGSKLAKLGLREKDMDLVGPKKSAKPVRL